MVVFILVSNWIDTSHRIVYGCCQQVLKQEEEVVTLPFSKMME